MNVNRSYLKIGILAALIAARGFSALAQTNQMNHSGPKDFTDFKLITERNIFDPNRRPPINPTYRPPVVVATFSLAGTMSYDNGLYAVFDGNNPDYHKVLQSGGRIASYTVAAVNIDCVKLSSGTNEVELKVGMQMQRGQDGKWSQGDRNSDTSYAAYSQNRRVQGGGRERTGNDRSFRNFNNGFSGRNRTGNRTFGSDSEMNGQTVSAGAGANEGNGTTSVSAEEPTDPVARMIARRSRETGGNTQENQNDNGNQDGAPVNVNGMSNENQPGNGNQPGNENRPEENQPGQTGQPDESNQLNRNRNIPNGGASRPQNPNLNNEN